MSWHTSHGKSTENLPNILFPADSTIGTPAPCTEYSCLTADYAIAMVKRYIQFGLKPEVFWLDAGWNTDAADFEHGKTWANTAGNWTVDTLRFPKGLRPVADEIHKVGS